jgi:pSer/pThr/pTyr-binding forkhead associated (FHA) protein
MAELTTSRSTVDVTVSLRIVSTAEAGREGEAILVTGPLEIGRDATCPVVIHELSVSRRHVRVEPAADGLRVIDLDSGNGVWVGADRVTDVSAWLPGWHGRRSIRWRSPRHLAPPGCSSASCRAPPAMSPAASSCCRPDR